MSRASREYLAKVRDGIRATDRQLQYIKILSEQAFWKRVELDYNCDYRNRWTKKEASAAIEMMKRKLSKEN